MLSHEVTYQLISPVNDGEEYEHLKKLILLIMIPSS